ncbi:hypothetical protein [Urechidicola vernalis]|uniref:Uncharacterized protein n=1 Tax=Urechidicola vernalis TaxID=3075600 RepID=A0ABU2Y2Y6_9FLAO|nr:hypothetical protein [Urechidicola sp. P050]MDT0552150.1 hypothetical protein [Urechidicola sp. P050]
MKRPRKYKDYYDYYKNRTSFPDASTGIFFIAICVVAYFVYKWFFV